MDIKQLEEIARDIFPSSKVSYRESSGSYYIETADWIITNGQLKKLRERGLRFLGVFSVDLKYPCHLVLMVGT